MQAVRVANTKSLTRDQWIEVRRRGIGGSDMAAICGLNPWRSPMHVYLDKLQAAPEQEDNEAMYFGRVLEDVVAKEFKDRNKARIQRVNAVLRHKDKPFLLANVDRLVLDREAGNSILEIKTTSAYRAKDWAEGAPDHVKIQAMHYLGVTGLENAFIAALIGGQKYVQYVIERDEETIEYLQKIAADFWALVEQRTPPELDGSDSSTGVLNFLYPESQAGLEIELPDEAAQLLRDYDYAAEKVKEWGDAKDRAANELKALLGEAETGRYGDRKVSWKSVQTTRLDTKALKAKLPEVYEAYTATSSSRRFTVK